jgi:hypothetical protein
MARKSSRRRCFWQPALRRADYPASAGPHPRRRAWRR